MATIHGNNTIVDDIKTNLYNLMDALKTAMESAGDSPRPAAVYNGHEQIIMTLPAISVDIDSIEVLNARGISAGGNVDYFKVFSCSIRVHTDFEGGYPDNLKILRLLISISNYIETNADNYLETNLNGYQALDMEAAFYDFEPDGYDESLTIGGQFIFGIQVNLRQTQA